ncbi:RagB/SusD family nutrient uptake outer membrane protein [Flammeovirgaceae bacterium SG7u.111]|nr:RagB/SusD family nutrient uptake outer membrane protein [Flammeovirgaceae bacterium SG7u.132]WPO33743.1 RagB/SusD family nutrient uptake outer membrane protein [Flammeovirgaceae bacterium SG7u.111]
MKKYIITLLLISVFASCEDVLEETNRNATNADLLYTTESGYESLINSCYSFSRLWYGKTEGEAFTDLGTDLFTAASGCSGRPLAYYASDFQSNVDVIKYMWEGLYSALNTCNTAIARVEEAPLSDDLKKLREGEARFLRAFYLWHITETWGEAILYTDEVSSVITTATHTSVDGFYEQIFTDLDLSIGLLNGTAPKENGRVTQVVAKAFKARMLLTRGQFSEASALAKEVINTGAFNMYGTFAETFDINNSEGTTNNEAIWWVNYNADNTLNLHFDGIRGLWLWEGGNHAQAFSAMVYWTFPGMWVSPDVNRPSVQNMPTLAFLDMFDETVDERYDVTFRTVYHVNDLSSVGDTGLELGDTAVVCTKYAVSQEVKDSKPYKFVDRSSVYDESGNIINSREYFVSMFKFQDPTRATGWESESKRDMYVMRISEMYMIVAEAEMMQGNMTEAATYINAVREKRAIDGKEPEMKITEADIDIDFILDERAREFAGEHLRWFDLKRTGKLVDRVRKYNPDAAPNIQDFHNVRPFPLAELDAITNKDEFKQNQGYN